MKTRQKDLLDHVKVVLYFRNWCQTLWEKKKNGYFVVHVKPKPHEHFQFDFYRSIEFWVLTYQIVTYTKEAVIASQFIPQVSLDSIKVNFSNEGYKFDLHCCDYIINRAFHTKKLLKWNCLVVHCCLYNK